VHAEPLDNDGFIHQSDSQAVPMEYAYKTPPPVDKTYQVTASMISPR